MTVTVLSRRWFVLTWLLLASLPCRADIFTVTNTADSGSGSLRQAIFDANANAGFDTIAFNILPAGPQTISLLSALPEVTGPVLIDGRTQSGYVGAPIIEVSGTNAGPANGFTFVAGQSAIRGIAITYFDGRGLELRGGNNVVHGNYIGVRLDGSTPGRNTGDGLGITNSAWNVIGGVIAEDRNVISSNGANGIRIEGTDSVSNSIFGNYIGTTAAGNVGLGNASYGIESSDATGLTIGGSAAGKRNVISANRFGGIFLGPGTSGCEVKANFVGTDSTGTAALGNLGSGILVRSRYNQLGGPTAGDGNLISANRDHGIEIAGADWVMPQNNVIQGNYIGTDVTGVLPLGNLAHGIMGEWFGSGNVIGGTGPWPMGNLVAFNGGAGLAGLHRDNPIRGNSVHRNGGLGINHTVVRSPVLNDIGDTDGFQNYPIILSAIVRGSETEFLVDFSSHWPFTAYRLEFFLNALCDPSGFGEGESLIFFVNATTDGSGSVLFRTTFPFALDAGSIVTATATDPLRLSTSEFCPCISVNPPFIPVLRPPVLVSNESGGQMMMELRRETNAPEVTVKYATINGTATAGQDFLPASGSVTLTNGQTNAFIKLELLEDDLIEGLESFQLQLTNPTNSAEIWSRAVVFIEDNDGPLRLNVASVSNTVTLCWTTNAVNYLVECAESLDNPFAWLALTNTPALNGTNWCVTTPAPGAAKFYRLRKQ